MWLKIIQRLKEQAKEIRNMSALQLINSDLSRSFLILLAVTMLSFETTDLFYKIVSIPLTKQMIDATNERVSSLTENNRPSQLQDYSIITERNLFLTTLKEAGGNAAEGIFDSGQKASDIDLKGTMASDSSFGYIIVEERENHKQKLYKLGDKIGSRKLTKITRNTAVLKNDEGEITLKIKETVEDSLLSNLPAAQRSYAAAKIPAFVKKSVDGNSSHLASIMNQAVVRPFLNKGVREGYIISNIAPNSIYEKAGIQNGDIITGINNNQMENAADIMQLLNSMKSGTPMDFTIRRQGRTETIHYTLE